MKLKCELKNKIAQKRKEEFLRKNNTILDVTSNDEAEEFSECESNFGNEENFDQVEDIDQYTNNLSAEVRFFTPIIFSQKLTIKIT